MGNDGWDIDAYLARVETMSPDELDAEIALLEAAEAEAEERLADIAWQLTMYRGFTNSNHSPEE